MSQQANIVVYDGQSTPAAHTLVAANVYRQGSDLIASYKETVDGIPDDAQGRITIKLSKLGSGVSRTSVRVELPVMESISGVNSAGYTAAPKVAHVDTVEVVGYFHQRSTISGRRSVRQMAFNLLNGIVNNASQQVNTTGPVPELFDTLVAPS